MKPEAENLNWQLDFHREAEKNSPAAVEKVPLKSHMKNKKDRVRELKKAVARHVLLATSNLNTHWQSAQEFLPLPDTDATIGPEELLYEPDYNDDLS